MSIQQKQLTISVSKEFLDAVNFGHYFFIFPDDNNNGLVLDSDEIDDAINAVIAKHRKPKQKRNRTSTNTNFLKFGRRHKMSI